VQRFLAELHATGRTIVLITHDEQIAAKIGISVDELEESLTDISRSSIAALDELWSVSGEGDTVSLQGQIFQQANQSTAHNNTNGYQVGAVVSVPLYQGGAEYSAVRQARQQQQATQRTVDDQRRTAQQQAIQAWETLVSNRAQADSTRVQIKANQIALEGVQREAIVGSRTTLDVLNAQQLLLQSEVTLVQNLAGLVTASYNLAAAIGRFTARDINLHVPLYDDNAYFRSVKDAWIGTGDPSANTVGNTNGSPSDNLGNDNH